MAHDSSCELRLTRGTPWLGCGCAGRAYDRDPLSAADLPVVVEDLTWDEL